MVNIHDLNHKIFIFELLNVLNGLFSSLFQPVSSALMGELSAKKLRRKVYHLRYFFTNAGAAIGSVFGGYLGITASSNNFLYAAIFYIIYAIVLTIVFNRMKNLTENSFLKKATIRESYNVLLNDKKLQILFFL